jgi:hypothetical protein
MIGPKKCYCALNEKEIVAIVEESKAKGSKETVYTYLTCENASECDRETFCKFINPLSNRIPIKVLDDEKKEVMS